MSTQQRDLSYLWHWWINSLAPDGPAGDPHERHLYDWKSALESMGYFESYLHAAFTDSLRTQHQQCSHSVPVPLEGNRVRCALGKTVTECPILLSLKAKFEENHKQYKDSVPAEAVYELMARTCAWHMLIEHIVGKVYIDWNEGAMQDESDRKYWDTVYGHMSQSAEGGQDRWPQRRNGDVR